MDGGCDDEDDVGNYGDGECDESGVNDDVYDENEGVKGVENDIDIEVDVVVGDGEVMMRKIIDEYEVSDD